MQHRYWSLILLVSILLSLTAGCTAPPPMIDDMPIDIPGLSSPATPAPVVTVQPVATPTVFLDPSVVSTATPYPTMTPGIEPVRTQVPIISPEIPSRYVPIYSQTIQFRYNEVAVIVDVYQAPLIITTYINPITIRRTIAGTSQFGGKEDFSVVVSRVSENAWYECTVRNIDTKEIVAKDGYGRSYSNDPIREITIRRPGMYHITFGGNMVEARINMTLPERSV
ncbi:MAG: hypothetical protein Q7J09_10340 [Methanocalculus sp.]|uniref:hypothetical protein n=1 Tax=Methanocalculus sp. TaxID=2004547 RepID=UPI002726E852|nr:hypothetical protein [Methanocalculus sp.]MDO9540382.1 hypothetical protein [Methanocalculus sp.]